MENNYEIGKKYFEEKNFESAELYLKKAMEENNLDAYNLLAIIKIQNKEFKKAEELFRVAAEGNHAMAQCNLGKRYFFGDGVEKNKILGMKLLKKSMEQGYDGAYNSVGIIEARKGNFEKSNEYFEISAQKENKYAQYNLAKNCLEGKGIQKDILRAKFWAEKSANQGHKPAIELLKKINESYTIDDIKYIEKLSFMQKKDVNEYDFVCFCPEINEYMLVITVPWVAIYQRYYWIPKEDFELAMNNIDDFKIKYKKVFESVICAAEETHFMGAEALRDYECVNGIQNYITTGIEEIKNPFQHFFYKDKVLYAHIIMDKIHYAVVPKKKNIENGNIEIFYKDIKAGKIALFKGIKINSFSE